MLKLSQKAKIQKKANKMIKLNTYSAKGTKKTPVSLPKGLKEDVNKKLIAQAARVHEARSHRGLSKVKGRSEVTASTRKIYRQKGTGGARHGARSAPIFVGGGKAHGPKGVKRELSLPKKMAQKALKSAINLKVISGKAFVVDGVPTLKKTKDAASLINKIISAEKEINDKSRFTFALSRKSREAKLALRNLAKVDVVSFSDLNAHKVYFAGNLLLDKEIFGELKDSKTTKSGNSVKK
jgi:large subunit ribosomal protein L4